MLAVNVLRAPVGVDGEVAVHGAVRLYEDGTSVVHLVLVGVGGQVVPRLVAPLVLPGGRGQRVDVTETLTGRRTCTCCVNAAVIFVWWAAIEKRRKKC